MGFSHQAKPDLCAEGAVPDTINSAPVSSMAGRRSRWVTSREFTGNFRYSLADGTKTRDGKRQVCLPIASGGDDVGKDARRARAMVRFHNFVRYWRLGTMWPAHLRSSP